jgi:hypothetical protein
MHKSVKVWLLAAFEYTCNLKDFVCKACLMLKHFVHCSSV